MSAQEVPENMTPDVAARFDAITKNLDSWVDAPLIAKCLARGEAEPMKIYWGTATTGAPHLGYFVPMYKIADFLAQGCAVTILFANLHGFLDNMKSSFELLAHRCDYYEVCIKAMLTRIGVPLDRLRFVRGTSYQLSEQYTLDMYKMSALVTTHHTQHAGAEVVKKTEQPPMSALLYPILQALDEEYLGVDVQFGGVDQRKIFMFARDKMPLLGYRKRAYLMNPLIPGLGKSGKMSSSEPASKIDFDDSDAEIRRKIKVAYSVDGVSDNNGLLAILKHVVFRCLDAERRPLVVPRADKFGGPQRFATFDEAKTAFERPADDAERLMSGDLKQALIAELCAFLAPLRDALTAHHELFARAYPERVAAKAAAAGGKKGGGGGGKKAAAATTTTAALGVDDASDVKLLDLRVGKIVSCAALDGSDKLYLERIDVGDAGGAPRQVLSGLARHVPLADMQQRLCVVLCNLKPAKLAGEMSHAMVMCADDGERVELLAPPAAAAVGARIVFTDAPHAPAPAADDAADATDAAPAQINTKNKNNAWSGEKAAVRLADGMCVDADGVARYKQLYMRVVGCDAQPCTAPTLKNAPIK